MSEPKPTIFSSPSQAHGADGFWSRCDRSGGEAACWPWLGARNNKRGILKWQMI